METMSPGLRERKKADTRDRILRAALDLFTQHSYDEVTLADIAARADVASRTVCNYYSRKADILVEYRQAMLEVVEATIAERESDPPLERLRAALMGVARANVEQPHGRLAQRLIWHHASLGSLRRVEDRFESTLRQVIEGARLRPGADPALAAMALAATHLAALQRWALSEGDSDLEEMVALVFEQWERGVR